MTNKGLIGRGAFGSVYLVENDAHEQVNRWSEKSGHFPSVRFLTVCKGRTFKLEQYRVYLRGEEGWGVGGGGSPPRPIPSSPQQYSMQSVQVLYIKPYIMAQQILKYSRNPLSPPPLHPPAPPTKIVCKATWKSAKSVWPGLAAILDEQKKNTNFV